VSVGVRLLRSPMMYFLDIAALKDELSVKDLPASDSLRYLIGFWLLSLPSNAFAAALYATRASFIPILSGMLFVAGVLYCYARNGGVRGRDFLSRFIALSWVVSLRFLLIVTPAVILVLFVLGTDPSELRASPVTSIASVLIAIIYYYRVSVHVDEVASRAA
jgi:hypothetical protein